MPAYSAESPNATPAVRQIAVSRRNSPAKSHPLSSASSTYTAPHGPQSRCTCPLTGDTNDASALVGRTSAEMVVTVNVVDAPPSWDSEHWAVAAETPRFSRALRPPGTEIW